MNVDEVISLLKQRKIEEALDAMDTVEDKKLMAEKLTEFAGSLNYLKGLPGLTEVLLRRSLMLDDKNPVTHYDLGVLYSGPDVLDEANAAKAKRAYKNALKIREDFHEARYNLALLYYFTGRIGEAR